MTYVLGINAFHGETSAALLADGELVAAVEEERFNRIKYTSAFPVQAIRYCLETAGIDFSAVDHVAVGRNPLPSLGRKILHVLKKRPSASAIGSGLTRNVKTMNLKTHLAEEMGIAPRQIRARFHRVEHHLAHCASAFLVSGYPQAAVMSVDGFGDFVSLMLAAGQDKTVKPLVRVWFPHSLGLFYTAITQYCGFVKYGDEGKFMGLAPLGEPRYVEDMREMVRLKDQGRFELNLDYFVHHYQNVYLNWQGAVPEQGIVYSPKLIQRFGPPRTPGGEITKHYADMAASAQMVLEEVYFHALGYLQQQTGLKRLCLAGGVALNSVANGKILLRTQFKDVFIQPAAGDAGLSLGAAYYVYHAVLGRPRNFHMTNAYTGPDFSPAEIREVLAHYRLPYEEFSDGEICRRAAQLMSEKKVVGWFQGRMEFGPRALGNRSIVVDPRFEDMKDILNSRVKNRERFRPFAPSVLEEQTWEWFEQEYPDPFMLKVYQIRRDKQGLIPAVTHVDGSGRLQTVSSDANPRYWRLITEYQKISGIPVILNTSFNENEPIVCTPAEAVECFLRTKMDCLILDNYLVSKKNLGRENGGR
ncbi:MAG: carbamoyltransferase [Deltaproteobacteria bacterium]|nr:MAG: carbamoyltransferase [Deltaproteobacteria bacterium]